ncbi:MAG: sodium:alanine symporter family protein, partial [Flavobacteriales bacterium]|nr:sodium:alanine symporter family protein [Flavobacteriales bacterium]
MKARLSALILSLVLIPLEFLSQAETQEMGLDERINEWFTPISNAWQAIVLFTVPVFGNDIPFVVILLVAGAAFFTIYFSFINVRRFPLAINVVRGKYDDLDHHEADESAQVNIADGDVARTIKDESQEGEVSHFQALATAVSGTVGLGNIAGVALAIALGGPGATFWMIICGLLGMSTKFVECTLGVRYRDVDEHGKVYGGPMYYLSKGLKERGFTGAGKFLAVLFAIL